MSDKKPYHVDPHPDHPQSAIDLFNSGEQPTPPDIDALVERSKRPEVGGYASTPKHASLEDVANLPIGGTKH
jgi:hypothetical protein